MSQIPFVAALGDALESATEADRARAGGRAPRRSILHLPRFDRRLFAALAVVLVGGGAATAALLQPNPTTTLAAHGLACISGTDNGAPSDAYNVPQHGQSPTVACSPVIGVPASRLIACADPKIGAIVYESNGSADQCETLHLRPLPAGYASANANVYALEQDLQRAYDARNCTPLQELAREANRALVSLGFTGWHAVVQTTQPGAGGIAGPCGAYPGSGVAISDPASALNAGNHTVMIVPGVSRTVDHVLTIVEQPVVRASGRRCYSLGGLERMVAARLAAAGGRGLAIRFTVSREQQGTQAMFGRQHFYDEGCVIAVSVGTAVDGRSFVVALQDRHAAPSKAVGLGSSGPQRAPGVS
jgi:hypothetical protein